MAFLSQLEDVAITLVEQSLAVKILLTLIILAAGILVARLSARVTRWLWESTLPEDEMAEKVRRRARSPDRMVEYSVVVLTLVAATVYINSSAVSQIAGQIIVYTPRVITAALVFLLGILLVKGLIYLIKAFIESLEVKKQAQTVGLSPRVLDASLTGIKLFLYLVVVEVFIIQLGVSPQIIHNTVTAASYGVVLLLALLGFFGFKDLIQNYAAGIYLRGSEVLKPGKRVKLDDETGEIRDISPFSTTVNTDSGYFLLAPNKNLMNREILFKRVKADVEMLEDITDYFVSETSPYQGAAATEMALAMFGFDVSQGDISEELEDEHSSPDALGETIEDLTRGEVRTAVVSADKVTGLGTEFKVWFNNDALLLPYFDKSILFPGSESERYVLCVAVEGNELLVLDPSKGESGGVYYVEAVEMEEAMKAAEDGGYLVLAPRGTTSFWRIKNGLIYANLSLYRKLSKNLEVQLSKILRRGEVLKQVVPEVVDDFIERWRVEEEDDSVTRMWRPENNGDKQIDEFTDNS